MENLTEKDKEAILKQARKLQAEPDVELAREISCKFYREGCHPNIEVPTEAGGCGNCLDPAKVLECRGEYLARIFKRPMQKWSKEFDSPFQREKKALHMIETMGQMCDNCYLQDKCPQYELDAMCSIDFGENISNLTTKEIVNKLIDIQSERVNKAKLFEKYDGGIPDQNLSTEIDRLSGLVQMRSDLDVSRVSVKIEAESKGPSQQAGGGILSQLFGGALGGNKEQKELPPQQELPTIDVPFVEDKEEAKMVKKVSKPPAKSDKKVKKKR